MSQGSVKNPETDGRVKRTEQTLTLLRQAAAIDCTWAECAFYAGISEKTLYEWFADGEKGKKLREELDALRNKPVLKARQEVVKGLNNNPEFSLKYLERKRKAEFSLRQEHTGKDGEKLPTPIMYVSRDDSNKENTSTE